VIRASHRVVVPRRVWLDGAERRVGGRMEGAGGSARCPAPRILRNVYYHELARLRVGGDAWARARCEPRLLHQTFGERAPRSGTPRRAAESRAVDGGIARRMRRGVPHVRDRAPAVDRALPRLLVRNLRLHPQSGTRGGAAGARRRDAAALAARYRIP